MKRIYVAIAIIFLINASIAFSLSYNDDGLQDSPWPMFQHDVRHTGRSEYDTSDNVGIEKWKVKLEDPVKSTPAIAKDGTIYVQTRKHLYAISSDAKIKWKVRNGDKFSSPAIAKDGTIYVGDIAVLPNGTIKWRLGIGEVDASPAIADDGTIYIASFNGYLYAVSPDGTIKWSFKTKEGIVSSPAIADDGTIYIGDIGGYPCYLYAISPNGTLKWKFEMGGIRASPSIAEDGTIYIGSDDARLYAIYPNGTLKWKESIGGMPNRASPVIGEDGTIYVGSGSFIGAGDIYALSPDGKIKWRITGIGGNSLVMGGDGTLYIGAEDDYIYAINPNGTIKWKIQPTSDEIYDGYYLACAPAIGEDGTIYIGTWFSSEKGDWGYLHAIKDGMPKGIKIIRPREDHLYIFDREIMKYRHTCIVGWVTVQVEITSEENVDKVEFYAGYKLRYTDYSPPFEWRWEAWKENSKNRFFLWDYILIAAKAYYNDGDAAATRWKSVEVFDISNLFKK